LKYNFVTQVLSVLAIMFVKISICLFLARLAPTPTYKRICYGIAIFMGIYSIGADFTIIFQCTPIEKIWNRLGVKGTCFTVPVLMGLSYTHSTINISSDILLVFLPVPMLWKAQIAPRKKVILYIILALGLFASCASCVKVHYLVNYGETGDFLWDSVELTRWTIIEINVGIACACIPALSPLLRRFLNKTGLTSKSFKSGQNSSGHSKSHQLQIYPRTTVSTCIKHHLGSSGGKYNSDESIVPKEEGIHVTQELGVQISQTSNPGSLEEGRGGYTGGPGMRGSAAHKPEWD